MVCSIGLGKKFIKEISLGKPKDNCGMGNTVNQRWMRLKQINGWLIKRRLLRKFFHPFPESQWGCCDKRLMTCSL